LTIVYGGFQTDEAGFTADLEAMVNHRQPSAEAALVPEMEPLIQPSNDGGDGTEDNRAFGEHAQQLAAAGALFRDWHPAVTRGRRGKLHGGHHVHIFQSVLALNARCRCDEALQTVNLTVQLIRLFG